MGRRAAAAGLAALALAACGNDLDAFRDDVNPLESRAAEQRAVIAAQLRSIHLRSRADARALRAQTAKLARIYDEIAALDPPSEVERAFAGYVRANREIVRDLDRFADGVVAGRVRALRRIGRQVATALGQSQSARLRWLE